MGQAREVMDRATAAIFSNDMAAVAACYSSDVVAQTPDYGTIHGVEGIVRYMRQMDEAFPDMDYELTRAMEDGQNAIDEGIVTGTNTGPRVLADGTTLPPTGRSIRLRTIDVATVEGGVITRHDFYFDQMEMAEQLGLLAQQSSATT